ncbi:MAG: DUF4864 domain-containing protein [Pseudomonadota bacterium]
MFNLYRAGLYAAACCMWFASTQVSAGDAAGPHLSDTLQPSPDLSPREVVAIQLEALRHNPADDKGIEVVYRFAAPSNRANTGPLSRFTRMIKNGPYALMLNFDSVLYDRTVIKGERARLRVVVTSAERKFGYTFILGRQTSAPYEGCWMTEMVSVVPLGGQLALAH